MFDELHLLFSVVIIQFDLDLSGSTHLSFLRFFKICPFIGEMFDELHLLFSLVIIQFDLDLSGSTHLSVFCQNSECIVLLLYQKY